MTFELESVDEAGRSIRRCDWCKGEIRSKRPGKRFDKKACRQAAFRLRRRREVFGSTEGRGTFAYADPPYPGLAARYYGDQPSFAGEVDHRELIAKLMGGGYHGWALSTAARSLRDILPLCPAAVRVCAWVKPIAPAPRTLGIHNLWEPLIVFGGRQEPPGRRDWLRAQPARFGGSDLIGRKPDAFCAWLFDLLGMRAGDELVDLFPGSGAVGRAWASLTAEGEPSPGARATTFADEGTREAVGRAVATASPTRCRVCGAPATCVGHYEAGDALEGGCDVHCGHGNEDGYCDPVGAPSPGAATTDVELEGFRAALAATDPADVVGTLSWTRREMERKGVSASSAPRGEPPAPASSAPGRNDFDEEAHLRAIRALQGAPLEGCGNDDCDDCYPK